MGVLDKCSNPGPAGLYRRASTAPPRWARVETDKYDNIIQGMLETSDY